MVVYAGETVRITAADLTHSDSGSVTSGATVTVQVFDAAGVQVGTDATATASGDDWSADIAAPATAGEYEIKATAVKSGATWKGKEPLRVLSF